MQTKFAGNDNKVDKTYWFPLSERACTHRTERNDGLDAQQKENAGSILA